MCCPICAFEQNDADTCARCGVVFAKARAAIPSAPRSPAVEENPREAGPWRLLAAGLIAALIAHAIPFIQFILTPLVTLFHEFGHAAAAWLLGCPAIPAFDFVYGGGITQHQSFQLPLAIFIAAGWGWLGWTFRRNPRTLAVLGVCAGAWLLAVSSEWRRELVIASMGHLGELMLAGSLLYMALAGVGWRIREIERPLGAFAASFVLIQTARFAWRLRHDAAYLAEYREGKGGSLMSDLEVVALDIKIWTGVSMEIPEVAGWLFFFALLVPAAAILLYVYRGPVRDFARSLLVLSTAPRRT
jgi:membrane protein CcdC involved in cytochrome C biogenesis